MPNHENRDEVERDSTTTVAPPSSAAPDPAAGTIFRISSRLSFSLIRPPVKHLFVFAPPCLRHQEDCAMIPYGAIKACTWVSLSVAPFPLLP
jgi:hypothetical protein